MERLQIPHIIFNKGSSNKRLCEIADKVDKQDINLDLILKNSDSEKRVPVYLKFYGECPKHYATLYRTEDCKHQFGRFNPARCLVSRMPDNDTQFVVSQTDEEHGLIFEASSPIEADEVIKRFRTHYMCPRSPSNRRATRRSQADILKSLCQQIK